MSMRHRNRKLKSETGIILSQVNLVSVYLEQAEKSTIEFNVAKSPPGQAWENTCHSAYVAALLRESFLFPAALKID